MASGVRNNRDPVRRASNYKAMLEGRSNLWGLETHGTEENNEGNRGEYDVAKA